jgi:hypothetical protein
MLYSVYALQESMELLEFKDKFKQACKWAVAHLYSPCRQQKHNDFTRANLSILLIRGMPLEGAQDCSSASADTVVVCWSSHLLLPHIYLTIFCLTQLSVNLFPAESTPNLYASELQSMMQSRELYTELTYMVGFHKAFMNPHFKWLQESNELTKHHGFRSHHMAERYFLMSEDLNKIQSTICGLLIQSSKSFVTAAYFSTKKRRGESKRRLTGLLRRRWKIYTNISAAG